MYWRRKKSLLDKYIYSNPDVELQDVVVFILL